ncbi:hypothetical protein ES703_105486 [subsurface metagenome]
MAFNKLMPGAFYSQIRFRIIAIFNKDVFDGGLADLVPKINDLVGYFLITPSWIFFLELYNEIYNFFSDSRPSDRFAIFAAIIFLSDQFAKPTQYSIRRKQHGTLLQHFSAESFGLGSHSHPLTIR